MALVLENPVVPKIIITKGATVKTYDPLAGIFDANIIGVNARCSTVDPMCDATLVIEDSDLALKTMLETGTSEVQIFVGKTSFPASNRIYLGYVDDFEVDLETFNKAVYTMRLASLGWRFSQRIWNIQRHQKRLANGVDLDTTDTTTELATMIKYGIQNKNAYPTLDAAETIESQDGIGITQIANSGIKLADYLASLQKGSSVLNQISEFGDRPWWIDVANNVKDLVWKDPVITSSGHLLTDKRPEDVTWTSGRVHFIKKMTVKYIRSPMVNRWYGLGADRESKTIDQTADNAGASLFATDRAHQFQPVTDKNIHAIALKLVKIGTPTATKLTGALVEDNVDNPTGAEVKPFEIFVADIPPTTADYVRVAIQEARINSGKKHWIVLNRVGADALNTVEWRHDNGITAVSATKTNGTWTVDTTDFKYAMRVYSTAPLLSIAEDASSITDYKLREEVLEEPNITKVSEMTKMLRAKITVTALQKQVVEMEVYPADNLLPLAQTARVEHQKWGLNNDFEITDIHYQLEGGLTEGNWTLKVSGLRLIP